MRRLSPCSQPGCLALTDQQGKCVTHRRSKDQRRGSSSSRGYGSRWQRLRANVLAQQPTCVQCGQPATDVDHIDNLGPHGPRGQDLANLQSLCHACHARKTAVESSGWAQPRQR